MSAALVKELRERTGLGLLECKRALAACGDDVEAAIEELRKSSGMKAAKKAGRTAADGVVAARVADDGSYAVVAEINSETDFVARDAGFLAFVDKVLEAAFTTRQSDVAALMAGDLELAREALVQKIGENISVRRIEVLSADAGVVAAYVHGNNRIAVLVALTGGDSDLRIRKFLAENSLLEQAFVKDPDVTVGKLVSGAGAGVASFVRFEVGEGIVVEKVDFADEVAAQLKAKD